MTTYYVDTSVLLKRHVNEPGYRWVCEVVDSSNEIILTTELSVVEVYSALNRLVRENQLTQRVYQELTAVLTRLFDFRYELIPLSANIRTIACNLLERHPLRAYDSMHLASALLANQEFASVGMPGLTFLSADQRLLTAAAAEGLRRFDPSTIP